MQRGEKVTRRGTSFSSTLHGALLQQLDDEMPHAQLAPQPSRATGIPAGMLAAKKRALSPQTRRIYAAVSADARTAQLEQIQR